MVTRLPDLEHPKPVSINQTGLYDTVGMEHLEHVCIIKDFRFYDTLGMAHPKPARILEDYELYDTEGTIAKNQFSKKVSLVQDQSLDLLASSPQCYHCTTYAPARLHAS